ncbi:MAG: Aspartyl/glutamyl-tRNA(Asn/Gln) amidotransferase subunit B [Thermotoga sp. 47_83]|jgi:aspartyl-tRNA(Asn)/glutamyl-tRNA(Gln) amidotransferase subunit B|uniref:Aspartyl/glutamyl-tRNA(Asn/Gln) amidotransferase subunit B n=2 Tax=Thermotoga petrophila TaxID=93929 RepID=GATB_THEP1|nr:Asp-tRNA(Asn)/Glu-tRNA(Gln) amidotransferase subunit GatB [Thermotoga petrophila]A5IMT3.1 RecName: Full=Aspartyl/glutamyl-tRNA(Asn/Gln) amidotransferase subunit B; Short=Asp/Glu-ADT subunit B [Thermotoga petrophila RKU-1]KUK32786.1 MAG: Aspartyl/glutamyl-tRNA(Asn/Gln) amidotransferase subunit B [Thermotoga sp. 47_83]MDK2898340.1 aspartyl-tRNA(Asn)/glutamyl-tRNA(Gln) amidotransferase subunit [Thermotoga sp.]ABQ47506.1 aspartyl/glutamyl-tRNA(Asn/Gln) amidotransferase subunit B [Thermotoga petr
MRYRPVIGLEIHVQLSTKTKAFCSCPADVFELPPNTAICPVCTGQPGALPVPNEEMIRFAVKTALALNCKIHKYSRFDRKNYFYPDLPKGYQISQYFYPIATEGFLEIDGDEGRKKVRIRRLHLEEDAGKLVHEGDSITRASYSLVDMNRCGVPLIEIVTEPDISSPREARVFMEKLRSIVRYLGVSTGDMEKGALRCDANISVVDTETGRQSNRVEVKNMNSFRFVEKALEYEFERIVKAMERGEDVERETRGWDMTTKTTVSMRGKEEESDYRYFPEPDIPPVVLSDEYLEEVKKELPELPDEKAKRFMREYDLPEYDAKVLTSSKELAEFFEECVKVVNRPKDLSNWIMTEVLRELNERNIEITESKLTPQHFADLFKLMDEGKISIKIAKEIFPEVFETGKMPSQIVEEKGLVQISDEKLIEELVKKAMEQNPKAVQDYKSGKKKAAGFFVGYVMRETKGKANPELTNRIIQKLLEGE